MKLSESPDKGPIIYSSKLDSKGRCSFPSPLRKAVTVSLIFAPEKGKAIAVFDIGILSHCISEYINISSIPFVRKTLNSQGKITFGGQILNQLIPHGYTWKPGDSIRFMVSPRDENIIEIYFTPQAQIDLERRQNDIANRVIDILMKL